MKKKVIIWGYKSNYHTHSYIHSSYYKAFQHLGYQTYWFDGSEDLNNFDFSDCIFFTEDQVQENIPLIKSSKYILHHTNNQKYIDNDLDFINLGNYLSDCDLGKSPYFQDNRVEKISDFCFFDKLNKIVYQPWATDLLPHEIQRIEPLTQQQEIPEVHYVGTAHDNFMKISVFSNLCKLNNKTFELRSGMTDEENLSYIRSSSLSVDLRSDYHISCGYLPCRVFKNISYGRITGTNSKNVKEKLGDFVVYAESLEDLYYTLIESESKTPKSVIRKGMDYISENHTFLNRVDNLLKILL